MKRILSLIVLLAVVCFAAVATAADLPNLIGTWEGAPTVHDSKGGYYTGKLVLNITEQKGNAFHGSKTYQMVSQRKERTEGFSGTISSGGQIFIADHEDGYMIGDITKDGGMELQYGHTGKKAVAVHVVLKKK